MSEMEIGARYTLCVCDACGSIREGWYIPATCPHCGNRPASRSFAVTSVDRANGVITISRVKEPGK